MKTDLTRVRQAELAPAAEPRELRLVDLVHALHAVARNDAEAAVVLEYMLAKGHVRLLREEALAA